MLENSHIIKYNITNIERIIKLKSLLDNLTLTEKIFYSYFNGDIKFIDLGDIIICECNGDHIFTLEINKPTKQSDNIKNKLYLNEDISININRTGWFDDKLQLITHIESIINNHLNFNCIVIIYNQKFYY